MFGPDDRLYVANRNGLIDIFTIQRIGEGDYEVTASEELDFVQDIPNHDDDGALNTGVNTRQLTGITVAGTAANPEIYATSSDIRIGGPGGDVDLDTNSGVITRMTWNGTSWDAVDIVRGLSRSEENHATNGLEFVTINGTDYLIVCSGGHANAGGPSDNFTWITEFALSAALLSINLDMLEAMPILNDGTRDYIYDIPTLDDPTRANANGITDPNDPQYDGEDILDPFGGNDGLNQAMIVPGGPVQIFSAGFRNSYDLVVTADGKVYNTDNGANGGWGGFPENEGNDGTVTNNYIPGEPGSTSSSGGEQVNNDDHVTMITNDIQNYAFGDFYGGHPAPTRANPAGAGLYTNEQSNGCCGQAVFRTQTYDPDGSTPGSTMDASVALPANWPPVPVAMADARQGDWRGPGINNPDGPDDVLVTVLQNNSNGIDEYTASNFEGAMQGDLIVGKNGGILHRIQLSPDGASAVQVTTPFLSPGGNALGITCNSDSDPFPGTIWVAPFNGNIVVFEPEDFACPLPGDPLYVASEDNDSDGYTNQDEIDNLPDNLTIEDVICNGGNNPPDFDAASGGSLVSDLNDPDDDNDGILDANDVMQLGDPNDSGSDAFQIPVENTLLSDNADLKGYLGLGFTGLMNNGDANPNWFNWIDQIGDGPNPNDVLGGAVGAMTMQMTSGTANGNSNDQEKGFQYGVEVDQSSGVITVEGSILNLDLPLSLYGAQTSAAAELGIFIGDGTQSNFIKFVATQAGLEIVQEINDNPQAPITVSISTGNRPSAKLALRFIIDASTGAIDAEYAIDNGSFQSAGSLNAQGAILNAIQSSANPLLTGLIGTSGQSGVEVEGTWDYLNVESNAPYIIAELPDVNVDIDAPSSVIDLDNHFDDNQTTNLTYTVEQNTNSAIGTSINNSNNNLTLSFPSTPQVSTIIIRATDEDNLFIEDTFVVTVSEPEDILLRINAGGPLVTADDDGPDWLASNTTGVFSGAGFSFNTGNISTQNVTDRHASIPDYISAANFTALFTNERWDPAGAPEMALSIPLANGTYGVNLYMGNGFPGTSAAGQRVFSVNMEGVERITNKDLAGQYGQKVGAMESYAVTVSDGELNIDWVHVVENPLFNAIEILGSPPPDIPINVTSIPDQSNVVGDEANLVVVATGGNPNANFTYAISGQPDGVEIEPTNGLVFGEITLDALIGGDEHMGVHNVTITVSKPGSDDVTISFVWTINNVSELWTDLNENENYTERHECSFVQCGQHFLLFGGREGGDHLNKYDYAADSWEQVNNIPNGIEFNHFQAVEYKGLIWVIGAFGDNGTQGLNETPLDHVWTYDPTNDEWIQGPEVPAGRQRGSAGLALYNDKFYVVSGNVNGHMGPVSPLFDEFDPATGTWTSLDPIPNPRDHFHVAVIGDKLYAAGGRQSTGGSFFNNVISEVDVYDFGSQSWSTLPAGQNLPTPRAASISVNFQNKLYVAGGEGNGNAYARTDIYDPAAQSWSQGADLNHARHGTQGIVSGNGIFTAGGSPNQGGGRMHNMEVFGTNAPEGTALIASQLNTPSQATVPIGGSVTINVTNAGGNVGIVTTGLQITGANASEFAVTDGYAMLCPGQTNSIQVSHIGGGDGDQAQLEISYGDNNTAIVNLISGEDDCTVLYRVNAGGPVVTSTDSDMDWSADTGNIGTAGNSAYLTTTSSGTTVFTQASGAAYQGAINLSHPSIPIGTPPDLFTSERYDNNVAAPELTWEFPVDVTQPVDLEVRLYFSELFNGITTAGQRVFDVSIEGAIPTNLTNVDAFAEAGPLGAVMVSNFVTVTDGTLNIDFVHKGIQNPAIKGIEIIEKGSFINNPPIVTNPGVQLSEEGEAVSLQIVATDINPCGALNYTATNLPPTLTIDPLTGLITGTVDAPTPGTGAGAYQESAGVLIIEAENDFVDGPSGWNPITENGVDFLVASTNHFGNTNGQTLTYDIEISTAGVYRFHMKSDITGDNSTEENDSWFKIENTSDVHFFATENPTGSNILTSTQEFVDLLSGANTSKNIFYPAGNALGRPDHGNENPGNSGFFKIFRGGFGYKWAQATIDNNGFPVYVYFENPGSYSIQMSERSAGHKVDRFALIHIDDVSAGIPTAILDGAQSSQNSGMNVMGGASDNSPYMVTLDVSDGCNPASTTSLSFEWQIIPDEVTSSANLTVNQGADINASTFGGNSFILTNDGDVDIQSITVDLSGAIIDDVVFDPTGTAGDATAKCLSVNSGGGAAGFVAPADACVDPFTLPENGIDGQDGFNAMTVTFNDFNAGESVGFSVDIDPTSIKNDVTAGDAGSVSGMEMIGAEVTVTFANGDVVCTNLFEDGSDGGSVADISELALPLAAPVIAFDGLPSPVTTPDLPQTIIVTGEPNTVVNIVHIDSRLYIDAGGGGYDLDPFEANTTVAKQVYTLTLDGTGNGSLAVTLLQTSMGAGPDGGINKFIAAQAGPGGNSKTSNILVAEIGDGASLNGQVELQTRTDHSGDYTITLCDPLTDEIVFSSIVTADILGNWAVTGIPLGTYDIQCSYDGFLSRAQYGYTIVAGLNDVSFLSADNEQLLAGDVDNTEEVNLFDFSLLATAFGSVSGEADYNSSADFNGIDGVDLFDFSILATNYLVSGDQICVPTSLGNSQKKSRPNLPPTEAPKEVIDLRLENNYDHVTKGQTISIPLKALSFNHPIDGVKARISYDPSALKFNKVMWDGDLDIVLQDIVDQENGMITISAGSLINWPQDIVDIATLNFTITSEGGTKISLLDNGVITHGGFNVKHQTNEIVINAIDIEESEISLFPSPTSDKLNIILKQAEAPSNATSTLLMFDASGKLVKELTVLPNIINTVDVSVLPAGQYYLKSNNSALKILKPFIIN